MRLKWIGQLPEHLFQWLNFARTLCGGHTVLINGERGRRPSEFSLTINTPPAEDCPFCRGHEDQTPPSIEQDRNPDWNWRLFPNRYPAVHSDAKSVLPDDQGLDFSPAIGRHEVLIESADHFAQADEYSIAKWVEIFEIWQRRLRDMYNESRIRYVHIFRNQGYRGGATLVHPHQQIVGLPLIPGYVATRLEKLSSYCEHDACAYCSWVQS